MVGLVVLIDGKPAVLIADLPEENEQFQIFRYGLHALQHLHNNGLRFKKFRVPRENLLMPTTGDGLTIAYHGLNLGRLSLCATASATMRVFLANMLPWAAFRKTYGQPIQTRELVQRRLARLAGLIAGADALVAWGSWLIDQGYRGELECIIAKIFGSEAQKEAAIELFMKTHGGRSFLQGHHVRRQRPRIPGPVHLRGRRRNARHGLLQVAGQGAWQGSSSSRSARPSSSTASRTSTRSTRSTSGSCAAKWPATPAGRSANSSCRATGRRCPAWTRVWPSTSPSPRTMCQRQPREISDAMSKHQLKLADRQCRMAELSQRVQDTIVMLVTANWAHGQGTEIAVAAADILCQDLRRKLTGERPIGPVFQGRRQAGGDDSGGRLRRAGRRSPRRNPDVLHIIRMD